MFNILHSLIIQDISVVLTEEYKRTWKTLFPNFFYPDSYTILSIRYSVTEARVTVSITDIQNKQERTA